MIMQMVHGGRFTEDHSERMRAFVRNCPLKEYKVIIHINIEVTQMIHCSNDIMNLASVSYAPLIGIIKTYFIDC